MTNICRFVSIAIAAVDIPDSSDGAPFAPTHLAAIGLLVAERDGDEWRFSSRQQAIGAGESETVLLRRATRMLPESGTMLGWQLTDAVIQPLLEAGGESDPDVARTFLDRLVKLVSTPSIDLALHHGGASAPPFAEIAGRRGIVTSAMAIAEVESAWAFGERERLCEHVATQAVAIWRLWLAESNGIGAAAVQAFEAWLG